MLEKKELSDTNESDIQDVLARMPVGVAWANASGRILYVNRKFTSMFGYELGDLSTVHAWIEHSYANPEQARSIDEFWSHTLDGNGHSTEIDEIELDIRCKDGRIKTVLSGKIMLPNQTGALATFLDITPRKEKENIIRRQAMEDSMTGLLNRRAFSLRIEQRLRECEEAGDGSGMALLLIDLDGFKTVNDTFGHDQGDVLLQKVAERLKLAVRDGDTLCRIGGDEFGVVLHSVGNEATASHVAERILYGLTRKPYELGQTALSVGASIGIAIYPEDGKGEIALFKHADQALYRAKNSGKGRWCR